MRHKPILPWVMRFFSVLQLLTGVGFIIYALILESPPKTAIPIGLIIIGIIAILSFFVGCVGSCYKRWCLSLYLMLGTLVTLAELGIVLSLFFNLDNVVDNMSNYQLSKQDADFQTAVENGNATWNWSRESTVRNALEIGRWVFLVVIILQLIGLIVAISMKTCCYRTAEDYEDFEAQAQEAQSNKAQAEAVKAQIQMENLKQSIGKTSMKSPGTDSGSNFYASSSRLYKS
ncbi:hypothetical protein N2152v2_001762 [Parachlorella kessleri]